MLYATWMFLLLRARVLWALLSLYQIMLLHHDLLVGLVCQTISSISYQTSSCLIVAESRKTWAVCIFYLTWSLCIDVSWKVKMLLFWSRVLLLSSCQSVFLSIFMHSIPKLSYQIFFQRVHLGLYHQGISIASFLPSITHPIYPNIPFHLHAVESA